MKKGLFAKKSIDILVKEAAQKGHTFRRSLGPWHLIAIGIGTIVGTGLFVLTGQVAAEVTGPSILLSFLIAGGIATFAALCYAEFAALIPIAGSAYSYAYATLGELVAYLLGWGMTMQYLMGCCAVAVAWSGYFVSLLQDFGCRISPFISQAPLMYHAQNGWYGTGAICNLPAIAIVVIMGGLISLGIKMAAHFNTIMVLLKLSVVVLFICFGMSHMDISRLTPFIPENQGTFGVFGWSGVLRGAGILFFAFIGFDALSTLTQETKRPQKDLPRGMMGALFSCTAIYIAFAVVLLGLVAYPMLGGSDPIGAAISMLGPQFAWLRLFVKIAILAGFTSVIMVTLLGQSRVFYTMAHDGLLPKKMAKMRDTTHVPLFTTIVVTAAGALVAGLFPVGILGQLVSMSTLLTFAIVCFAVILLRKTQPHLPRPFSVPFVPWVPLFGGIICIVQMLLLPLVTWIQLFSWLGLGAIIYFSYSYKRSKVQRMI